MILSKGAYKSDDLLAIESVKEFLNRRAWIPTFSRSAKPEGNDRRSGGALFVEIAL